MHWSPWPTNTVECGRLGVRSAVSGFQPRLEDLGLTQKEIDDFIARTAALAPGRGTTTVRAALVQARAALEYARDAPVSEIVVTPALTGWPANARYRLYRLDALNCSPGDVYRKARPDGRSHADALAAGRQAEAFKPQQEGTGPVPALSLPAGGAVVRRHVPDGTLVAGNPAEVKRFDASRSSLNVEDGD